MLKRARNGRLGREEAALALGGGEKLPEHTDLRDLEKLYGIEPPGEIINAKPLLGVLQILL